MSPKKPWGHASASQIKTFRRCNRKWYLQKIEGLTEPSSPAAALGNKLHTEMEEYLLGRRKLGDLDRRMQPAVDLGMLPEPEDVKAADIERRFRLEHADLAVPIIGLIDLAEPAANRITDHKTTSNLRYARTAEELRFDPQAVIYVYVAAGTLGYSLPLDFRHIYYKTKGTPTSTEVTATFDEKVLVKGWNTIVDTVRDMKTASTTPCKEVTANTAACGDYGGCPFRSRCAQDGVSSMGAMGGLFNKEEKTKSKEEKKMGKLSEMLKKRKESQSGEVSAPKPEAVEATPAPQEEATPAPTKTEINPPDGTPMDEVVVLEEKKKRVPKLDMAEISLATLDECKTFLASHKESLLKAKKSEILDVIARVSQTTGVEIITRGQKAKLIEAIEAAINTEPTETQAVEESEPVAVVEETKAEKTPKKVQKSEAEPKTLAKKYLFVGCVPMKGIGKVSLLSDVLAPLQKRVAEDSGVPYYGFIEGFNQGPKRVAALLAAKIENGDMHLPWNLYVDRKLPCTDQVMEVLLPHYNIVIRGLF